MKLNYQRMPDLFKYRSGKSILLVILILLNISFYSCKSKKSDSAFEVTDFNPLSNFEIKDDTLVLAMDLTNAITEGIEIPSKKQCNGGYFRVNFKISNNTDKPLKYFYKLFYQNESYKFRESYTNGVSFTYDERSGGNFYGSWIDPADSLHVTELIPNDKEPHLITDSFKIIGNPRNEMRYFGSPTVAGRLRKETFENTINEVKNSPDWMKIIRKKAKENNVTIDQQIYKDVMWTINDRVNNGTLDLESQIDKDTLNEVIKLIKNNPKWLKSIHEKATKNNVDLEVQIKKDALWILSEQNKNNTNNRWKRNPRVGNYEFTLLVATEEDTKNIPSTIKNISKEINGKFVNPFFELYHNHVFQKEHKIVVIKSEKILKTSLKYDLSSGIYVDVFKYNEYPVDTTNFSRNTGWSNVIFKNAQFEQFFHNLNRHYINNTIPVIADVTGEEYSQAEYDSNAIKFKPDQYIKDCIQNTKAPGKTVKSDPEGRFVSFKVPGDTTGDYRKENAGVNTRIGLTYGKYLARIKFPKTINKENVWNGLTCAYWLIYQEPKDWDHRSVCESGYTAKDEAGKMSPRSKTTYYSEIDFEILKTSLYWPATSYQFDKKVPTDDPKSNHDIIVACTNWDMACRDPKKFSVGAKEFQFGENKYVAHRWDDWYKALTIKTAVNHDSIFDRPFYYEIEWQPEKIIWRIGEDKNNLMEVGYMDSSITTIPDNQMVIVFTNEFHDSKWWPLSPFLQELVPFPKRDIESQILELEVR